MGRPLLVLQLRPEDETSDNEYAAIIRYGALDPAQTKRLRIEHTGIPNDLNLDEFSAVIVGGSPLDISTPEVEKTDIQLRIEADFRRLFDRIVSEDIPFLGACSGNGLLGAYLGASISRKYGEAVGCVSLAITEAGREDPLLRGFPEHMDALLGHKEACDEVPNGASLLVTGGECPVQMFRVGENVYATQFHPEGDAEGFITRIHAYKHHGYFEPHEADALISAVRDAETPLAHEILRRFVQRYCNR